MTTKKIIENYGNMYFDSLYANMAVYIVSRITKSEKISDAVKRARISYFVNNISSVSMVLTFSDGSTI